MEGEQTKNETVTISKTTLYGLAIAVLVILLIASIFTGGFGGLFGSQKTPPINTPPAVVPSGTTEPVPSVNLGTGSIQSLGSTDAAITIVEFSDLQCPFCGKFYKESLGSIKKDYVDTGKVRYYFRDYPLPFHANAQPAALAARCANEQGKFWELHDKLFEFQNEWSNLPSPSAAVKFQEYAKSIGIKEGEFKTCYESGKHNAAIQKDFDDGQELFRVIGIPGGTPSFAIFLPKSKTTEVKIKSATSAYSQYVSILQNKDNYIVSVTGALPYSVFKQIFDIVS